MNDRAIKLFEQAGAEAYRLCKENGHTVGEIDSIWVSIMAATLSELVVRECMEVANTYQNRGGNCYVDDMIAKHFGVEDERTNS